MSDTDTALAVREPNYSGLVMVVAPTEAEERLRQLQEFVQRVMVPDHDFGIIPGTKKNTLLQPGAQKLVEIYGLAHRFEDERPPIERWDEDAPFFAYFKRAVLTRRTDGMFLGSGVGSCNSREEKYAGRWVFEREVPEHLDITKLRSRSGRSKKNGKPYTTFRIPNPAIFDQVNTIEKMACKRALIHAVIGVTRSAGIFTQDLEDMSPEARGEIQDAEFEPAAARDPGDHTGHRFREPEAPPPDARALAERASGAATLDAAIEVLRAAKTMPRVRAVAYKRLIELSPDVTQLSVFVTNVQSDSLPDDIRTKLLVMAEERKTALEDAERGEDEDPRGLGGEAA